MPPTNSTNALDTVNENVHMREASDDINGVKK
jgi:hypothetical protein